MKIEIFYDERVLLLFDATKGEVSAFRSRIQDFIDHSQEILELETLDFVECVNVSGFHIVKSKSHAGVYAIGNEMFELRGHQSIWECILELTESFEKDSIGCHQYLTDAGDFELIISNERGW